MIQEKLLGMWKLISFVSITDSNEKIDGYGKKPFGYIIYTKQGIVQVTIMNEHFPQEEDHPAGVLDYLSYAGKYEIDEENNIITHHLAHASVPSWVGGEQERAFEFIENNRLVLRTTSTITVMGQTFVANEVTWEKVDQV